MGHGHSHHHHHPHALAAGEGARLNKLATLASTGMATLLLSAKLFAWWRTDSLAMLSSLTDSLFDVFASVLNLIAVRYALKPADDDHRFGHTAIEDIAGLAQSAFIVASMLIIVLQSFERLANPQPLEHGGIGIWVSLVGVLVTALLVSYQTYVARRTKSLIIAADRLHYAGDIAFNVGVLVAFYASMQFGWSWADPAMALLIAVAVLWSSRSIGMRAFNNLMDREMPDDEKAQIDQILRDHPQIRGVHKLKTRYSGVKAFIQMHADVDASLSFLEAHAIIDQVEMALEKAFPGAEIIIHPDPIETKPNRAFDA